MRRDDLNDLAAFAIVAEEGSFTRAAAKLGMSQPALSQAMKGLEERLKVRLLSRTTRAVSTTEAGETLLRALRPALNDITMGLAKVGAMGSAPSGTIRLTSTKNAVTAILMPALPAFLAAHPDVVVESIVDDNLTDIVANRFDAGIRFGNIVEPLARARSRPSLPIRSPVAIEKAALMSMQLDGVLTGYLCGPGCCGS
jgi:DNA-binding transcriptional LysR family regulator